MPEYLAPGVYIEEVRRGVRPIEGVSTSTAGFLGATQRGPETPRLITRRGDREVTEKISTTNPFPGGYWL